MYRIYLTIGKDYTDTLFYYTTIRKWLVANMRDHYEEGYDDTYFGAESEDPGNFVEFESSADAAMFKLSWPNMVNDNIS